MDDCQVDEAILEGSTVNKGQESEVINGPIEDDIANTCDAGIIDCGFIEEREATQSVREEADLSTDEISTNNNKFDEEMRVFLQPSPETVIEEIKEEEFCRNQEEELPSSEPIVEFIPVCDLNRKGSVSDDVGGGYSEPAYSEDEEVQELEILTGQAELCEGDTRLTSPIHSEHMKENIIGYERSEISAFKVESTEFVEDGLVDNLKNSTV